MRLAKFAGDRITLFSRIWIIALNITALSFLANALSLQGYFYTDGFGSFPDGLALAPVCWSLAWTGVALTINFCGVRHHPGIDVAMELIGWTLVVGTIWLLIWSVSAYGGYDESMCYSYHPDRHCTPAKAKLLFASEVIACITVIVSGVVHFWLFIRACRATHRRRLLDYKERTTVLELEERVRKLEAIVKSEEMHKDIHVA